MKFVSTLTVMLAVTPTLAHAFTQHDAHEHGVGELNIAMSGKQLAMELTAPGADIVGFEYAATSDRDKLLVEQALGQLHAPLALISLPADAQCNLVSADAHLEGDGNQHTEFHAEYLFECADMASLKSLAFPYFQVFPNALELEVQIVNDSGARAYEVERAEPQLEL